MSVNAANMELTPCIVYFGTKGSEVDLGGTLGNVKISIKQAKSDIKADQFGGTVLDRRNSGTMIKVTLELAEVKDKRKWLAAFPSVTPVGSDPSAPVALDFSNMVGFSDIAHAKSLILHPMSLPLSDHSQDYNMDYAVANEESEIDFGPTSQQKLKLVFEIYPANSTGKFLRVGDPTAT